MRQNRNQRRLCSADRDPSLRFFDPQTPRKSLQNQVFQQPARGTGRGLALSRRNKRRAKERRNDKSRDRKFRSHQKILPVGY